MSEIEEEIRRQVLAERYGASAGTGSDAQAPLKKPSTLHRWQAGGGPLGILAAIVLMLVKFGAPVFKALPFLPKLLLTAGSMFASMWYEAGRNGWPFAVGFILLIFVHECGHAVAMRMRGIPIVGMVFIPFMGALVAAKHRGKNVAEAAFIGIMGPVFGTLGGILCLATYTVYPERFWLALAQINFALNLFNLAPIVPLDGSRILPLISPKLIVVGVVLLFAMVPRNPMIWILALLSIPWVIMNWRGNAKDDPYFQATTADRWKYGFAYIGLAGFLALSSHMIMQHLTSSRPSII
jgi:Zn-dependent protease